MGSRFPNAADPRLALYASADPFALVKRQPAGNKFAGLRQQLDGKLDPGNKNGQGQGASLGAVFRRRASSTSRALRVESEWLSMARALNYLVSRTGTTSSAGTGEQQTNSTSGLPAGIVDTGDPQKNLFVRLSPLLGSFSLRRRTGARRIHAFEDFETGRLTRSLPFATAARPESDRQGTRAGRHDRRRQRSGCVSR